VKRKNMTNPRCKMARKEKDHDITVDDLVEVALQWEIEPTVELLNSTAIELVGSYVILATAAV
jgi:hypothetical protein